MEEKQPQILITFHQSEFTQYEPSSITIEMNQKAIALRAYEAKQFLKMSGFKLLDNLIGE